MIPLQQARDEVDARLDPVAGLGGFDLGRVQQTCEGTEVAAGELMVELDQAVRDMAALMRDGEPLSVFRGVLFRTFWLGHAYAEAAARDVAATRDEELQHARGDNARYLAGMGVAIDGLPRVAETHTRLRRVQKARLIIGEARRAAGWTRP